jgi:DNA repair exonuclease SbcCD ATPase subunit
METQYDEETFKGNLESDFDVCFRLGYNKSIPQYQTLMPLDAKPLCKNVFNEAANLYQEKIKELEAKLLEEKDKWYVTKTSYEKLEKKLAGAERNLKLTLDALQRESDENRSLKEKLNVAVKCLSEIKAHQDKCSSNACQCSCFEISESLKNIGAL